MAGQTLEPTASTLGPYISSGAGPSESADVGSVSSSPGLAVSRASDAAFGKSLALGFLGARDESTSELLQRSLRTGGQGQCDVLALQVMHGLLFLCLCPGSFALAGAFIGRTGWEAVAHAHQHVRYQTRSAQ